MKPYFELLQVTANDYSIRSEEYMGKRHFVIPAVMMVEGVHIGSAGALLHLANEFGRFPQSWNDRPVVVEHPKLNGNYVSASENPQLIEKILIGRIQNTKAEDGKLKAEAWIEEDRIKQISPLAYAYIMQKRSLQVSIGAFSDREDKEGRWNDEAYYGIARNYRPDHLALLPGGEGACSWTDGCGIRLNSAEKGGKIDMNLLKERIPLIQAKLESSNGKKISIDSVEESSFILLEEDSYGVMQKYNQPYTMSDDGKEVNWDKSERIKVDAQMVRTKQKGGEAMKEKIDKLLSMAKAVYSDEDRKWLEKLDEVQIDKLIVCAQTATDLVKEKETLTKDKEELEKKVQANEKGDGEKEDGKKEEDGKTEPEVNEKDAIKVLEKKLSDPEEFKKMMPTTMKESFEHGQKLLDKERADLIAHITANQASKEEGWTEEELKEMPMSTLEKMARAIPRPVDYSALGGVSVASGEEPLLPPGVTAN